MSSDNSDKPRPKLSDDEYKKILTPEQYRVSRQAGTEAPGSGIYVKTKDEGEYTCVSCGQKLFRSTEKFDAHCGWPSFTEPVGKSAVVEKEDNTHGMQRIEVVCSNCDGHLGHVFDDGPGDNGLRYCINSASLNFKKKQKAEASKKEESKGTSSWDPKTGKFTALKAKDIEGKELDFKAFDGRVALVTNVACFCGYTDSGYKAMVGLHKKHKDAGLSVLAFPCNQFGEQESESESDIKKFVESKYKPEFNMFSKIDVNGDKTHPVYTWLKKAFPGDIKWNFYSKFLIDRDGVPIARFEEGKATWDDIGKAVEEALKKEKSKL